MLIQKREDTPAPRPSDVLDQVGSKFKAPDASCVEWRWNDGGFEEVRNLLLGGVGQVAGLSPPECLPSADERLVELATSIGPRWACKKAPRSRGAAIGKASSSSSDVDMSSKRAAIAVIFASCGSVDGNSTKQHLAKP